MTGTCNLIQHVQDSMDSNRNVSVSLIDSHTKKMPMYHSVDFHSDNSDIRNGFRSDITYQQSSIVGAQSRSSIAGRSRSSNVISGVSRRQRPVIEVQSCPKYLISIDSLHGRVTAFGSVPECAMALDFQESAISREFGRSRMLPLHIPRNLPPPDALDDSSPISFPPISHHVVFQSHLHPPSSLSTPPLPASAALRGVGLPNVAHAIFDPWSFHLVFASRRDECDVLVARMNEICHHALRHPERYAAALLAQPYLGRLQSSQGGTSAAVSSTSTSNGNSVSSTLLNKSFCSSPTTQLSSLDVVAVPTPSLDLMPKPAHHHYFGSSNNTGTTTTTSASTATVSSSCALSQNNQLNINSNLVPPNTHYLAAPVKLSLSTTGSPLTSVPATSPSWKSSSSSPLIHHASLSCAPDAFSSLPNELLLTESIDSAHQLRVQKSISKDDDFAIKSQRNKVLSLSSESIPRSPSSVSESTVVKVEYSNVGLNHSELILDLENVNVTCQVFESSGQQKKDGNARSNIYDLTFLPSESYKNSSVHNKREEMKLEQEIDVTEKNTHKSDCAYHRDDILLNNSSNDTNNTSTLKLSTPPYDLSSESKFSSVAKFPNDVEGASLKQLRASPPCSITTIPRDDDDDDDGYVSSPCVSPEISMNSNIHLLNIPQLEQQGFSHFSSFNNGHHHVNKNDSYKTKDYIPHNVMLDDDLVSDGAHYPNNNASNVLMHAPVPFSALVIPPPTQASSPIPLTSPLRTQSSLSSNSSSSSSSNSLHECSPISRLNLAYDFVTRSMNPLYSHLSKNPNLTPKEIIALTLSQFSPPSPAVPPPSAIASNYGAYSAPFGEIPMSRSVCTLRRCRDLPVIGFSNAHLKVSTPILPYDVVEVGFRKSMESDLIHQSIKSNAGANLNHQQQNGHHDLLVGDKEEVIFESVECELSAGTIAAEHQGSMSSSYALNHSNLIETMGRGQNTITDELGNNYSLLYTSLQKQEVLNNYVSKSAADLQRRESLKAANSSTTMVENGTLIPWTAITNTLTKSTVNIYLRSEASVSNPCNNNNNNNQSFNQFTFPHKDPQFAMANFLDVDKLATVDSVCDQNSLSSTLNSTSVFYNNIHNSNAGFSFSSFRLPSIPLTNSTLQQQQQSSSSIKNSHYHQKNNNNNNINISSFSDQSSIGSRVSPWHYELPPLSQWLPPAPDHFVVNRKVASADVLCEVYGGSFEPFKNKIFYTLHDPAFSHYMNLNNQKNVNFNKGVHMQDLSSARPFRGDDSRFSNNNHIISNSISLSSSPTNSYLSAQQQQQYYVNYLLANGIGGDINNNCLSLLSPAQTSLQQQQTLGFLSLSLQNLPSKAATMNNQLPETSSDFIQNNVKSETILNSTSNHNVNNCSNSAVNTATYNWKSNPSNTDSLHNAAVSSSNSNYPFVDMNHPNSTTTNSKLKAIQPGGNSKASGGFILNSYPLDSAKSTAVYSPNVHLPDSNPLSKSDENNHVSELEKSQAGISSVLLRTRRRRHLQMLRQQNFFANTADEDETFEMEINKLNSSNSTYYNSSKRKRKNSTVLENRNDTRCVGGFQLESTTTQQNVIINSFPDSLKNQRHIDSNNHNIIPSPEFAVSSSAHVNDFNISPQFIPNHMNLCLGEQLSNENNLTIMYSEPSNVEPIRRNLLTATAQTTPHVTEIRSHENKNLNNINALSALTIFGNQTPTLVNHENSSDSNMLSVFVQNNNNKNISSDDDFNNFHRVNFLSSSKLLQPSKPSSPNRSVSLGSSSLQGELNQANPTNFCSLYFPSNIDNNNQNGLNTTSAQLNLTLPSLNHPGQLISRSVATASDGEQSSTIDKDVLLSVVQEAKHTLWLSNQQQFISSSRSIFPLVNQSCDQNYTAVVGENSNYRKYSPQKEQHSSKYSNLSNNSNKDFSPLSCKLSSSLSVVSGCTSLLHSPCSYTPPEKKINSMSMYATQGHQQQKHSLNQSGMIATIPNSNKVSPSIPTPSQHNLTINNNSDPFGNLASSKSASSFKDAVVLPPPSFPPMNNSANTQSSFHQISQMSSSSASPHKNLSDLPLSSNFATEFSYGYSVERNDLFDGTSSFSMKQRDQQVGGVSTSGLPCLSQLAQDHKSVDQDQLYQEGVKLHGIVKRHRSDDDDESQPDRKKLKMTII